jgi:aspartyl protease family protein
MKRLPLFIIIFVIFVLGTLLLREYKPDSMGNSDLAFNALYSILLISLFGSSLVIHYRNRLPALFQHSLIWIVLIILLSGLYHFRSHFNTVKNTALAVFLPSHPVSESANSITIQKSQSGHFHIATQVNSIPVEFIIDTGASQIVLTKEAAERIGIDTSSLNYSQTYNTANGTVRAAPITLNTLKIGSMVFANVRASVNQADMDTPLLGMAFLDLLTRYEVSGDSMTLVAP